MRTGGDQKIRKFCGRHIWKPLKSTEVKSSEVFLTQLYDINESENLDFS